MRCSLGKITLSSAPAGWGAQSRCLASDKPHARVASHSQTLCRGTHRVPSLTCSLDTGDRRLFPHMGGADNKT